MKFRVVHWVLGFVLLSAGSVHADIGDKVDDWFDGMNYATATAPGVYEGQSARYATLGGFSARAPITQPFNLVSVQTPKFSAGCGGIDFYAGGFSAIDSTEFINNLRAIGQNAGSLAFMLAIQIVSPQLSGVMEDIQTWADKYLNLNMDSCEAASALVGGAYSYLDKSKANCIAARQKNYGEDYSTASFGCTTGGDRTSTVDSDGDANVVEFVKGNLAWYVLMKDPFFDDDQQFSELMMNITGTMILTDADSTTDAGVTPVIITPAIVDTQVKERFNNIYKALLYGRDAVNSLQVYQCGASTTLTPDSCLDVSGAPVTVTPNWDGLYSRVDALLSSIYSKAKSDTALSAAEQGLIASTTVPIYRFISVVSTQFPDSIAFSQISKEYTDLIAQDILTRGLLAVIERVEQRTTMLEKGMALSANVVKYREDLGKVMGGIQKIKSENDKTAEMLVQMRDQIREYERALVPKLGNGVMSAVLWGKD